MFDHVQIKVLDFNASCAFYIPVLATLGHTVVLEEKGYVVGIGQNPHDMFEISPVGEQKPLSQAVHIAFKAPSREAVDEFYQVALKLGAKDNGKPGLRPQYEDGYYACFVIDLNGHNIEAVYQLPLAEV